MKHELIELSQNDPRWQAIKLGNSPTVTIGQAGCYVTSFCVVAQYFGHSVLPPELNQQLKDKGLFAPYDKNNPDTTKTLVSNDNDLEQLFADTKYTTSLLYLNVPPTPADLGKLRDLLSDPKTAVILMIDLGNGNVHFSPVVDCDGTVVTIMNTWNGKTEDFRTNYGDPKINILKYVIYDGTPAIEDPLVCDRKSVRDMLVTKASSLDQIGAYLNYPPDVVSHSDFGAQVIDKIKQIQTSYNAMNFAWTHQVSSNSTTGTTAVTVTPSPTTQPIPSVETLPQAAKDNFLISLFKSIILLGKEGAK